ncbi:MAG: Bacterial polymerase, alpha chain terminal domain [Planctomycetota bacterium]|jgi:hypothetical protein
MIEEKCGNCRFACQVLCEADKEFYSECRRYPPVFDPEMRDWANPSVDEDGWCGEWRCVTITKASKLNDVSVDDAGLSTRTTNALKAEGIFDFQVAAGMSEKDLLKIQNIGHLSVREIRRAAEIMKSKP